MEIGSPTKQDFEVTVKTLEDRCSPQNRAKVDFRWRK
jgi:hypothetical protein